MREACYCGRTGEIEDREPVAMGHTKQALRCPECGHLDSLDWLPEDARMLLIEKVERKRRQVAA